MPNKIIATADIVRIHPDGGITTIARSGNSTQKWRKLKNGEDVGEAPKPKEPTGEHVGKYVRMGVSAGGKTFTNLDELYDFFTNISRKLKNDYPAFHYDANGCQTRAQIIAWKLFDEYGVNCRKVFVYSSDYLINGWGKHVAPVVEIIGKNNKKIKWIIDPSMSETPLTLDNWLRVIVTKTKYVKLSPVDANDIILDYQQPFGKTIYWSQSREGAMKLLNTSKNFYFEAPKDVLNGIDIVKTNNFRKATETALESISKYNLYGKVKQLKKYIENNGELPDNLVNDYSLTTRVISFVDTKNLNKSDFFLNSESYDFGIYFYEKGIVPEFPFLEPLTGLSYQNFLQNLRNLSGNKSPKEVLEMEYPELMLILKNKVYKYTDIPYPPLENFLEDLK